MDIYNIRLVRNTKNDNEKLECDLIKASFLQSGGF